VQVRVATLNDARSIAEIHVAAWRAAYQGLMPQTFLDELSVEKRVELWDRYLSAPGARTTLVAEAVDRLAGFCVFGASRDQDVNVAAVGELIAINIHPAFWGRGFGGSLCERLWSEAPVRGWKEVTLWVLHENARARRFYERAGFVPDGAEKRTSKLVGTPLHEIRYRRPVAPGPH